MMRYVTQIKIAALLTGFLSVIGPALGQEQSTGEASQMLGMLYAARDTDDKCGGLTVQERRTLDQLIAQGLETEQPRPAIRDALEKGAFKDDVDCGSPKFLEMFRVVTQSADKKPSDEDDPEEKGPTEEALEQQLREIVEELPRGHLSSVAGCWNGDLLSWHLHLCFTNGGDKAEMTITQAKSSATCYFDRGNARGREGGAFFYSFSSDLKCSDGRSITHVEGLCPELSATSMSCLLSFYRRSNFFFTEHEASEEYLNGELLVTRE